MLRPTTSERARDLTRFFLDQPWLHVAIAAAIYLWPLSQSNIHLDQARDVFIALRIVRGVDFPLHGPSFAGTFHLGPAYYYLLALPLALTGSWKGVSIALGLLGASKFLLASRLGSRLFDRHTGTLWIYLLLAPGWSGIERFVPSVATLIQPMLLLLGISCFAWRRAPAPWRAGVVGLIASLMVHAHPSTIGFAACAAGMVSIDVLRRRAPMASVVALVVATLAPLLPWIVEQATTSVSDFNAVTAWVSEGSRLGSIRDILRLAQGAVVSGAMDASAPLLGAAPYWFTSTVTTITIGLGLLSICGLVARLRGARTRWGVAFLAVPALASLITVAWMRDVTPYYMVLATLVPLSGLIACGLSRALERTPARYPMTALLCFLIWLATASTWCQIQVAASAQGPALFPQAGDVKHPGAPNELDRSPPLLTLNAVALSGALLCASKPIVAHGAYAFHVLFTYALDARLACGERGAISALGDGIDGATHLAGLSRPLARTARAQTQLELGPIDLVPVTHVIWPHATHEPPDWPRYPPYEPSAASPQSIRIVVEVAPNDLLVIANPYGPYHPTPGIEARAGGTAQAPLASDAVTWIYGGAGPYLTAPTRWNLTIRAADGDRVDIFTVPRAGTISAPAAGLTDAVKWPPPAPVRGLVHEASSSRAVDETLEAK